jgi:glutamine synthetase
MEKYAKDLLIEGNTLTSMVFQAILPSAYSYRRELAEALSHMKNVGMDISKAPEKIILDELTGLTAHLQATADKLVKVIDKVNSLEGDEQAEVAGAELTVLLDEVRQKSDAVEAKTSDKFWGYPKYTELLF